MTATSQQHHKLMINDFSIWIWEVKSKYNTNSRLLVVYIEISNC